MNDQIIENLHANGVLPYEELLPNLGSYLCAFERTHLNHRGIYGNQQGIARVFAALAFAVGMRSPSGRRLYYDFMRSLFNVPGYYNEETGQLTAVTLLSDDGSGIFNLTFSRFEKSIDHSLDSGHPLIELGLSRNWVYRCNGGIIAHLPRKTNHQINWEHIYSDRFATSNSGQLYISVHT